MKFWDTSALVPLVLEEQNSRPMRQLMLSDTNTVVSFMTAVELAAAIARRTGDREPQRRYAASRFLAAIQSGWTVADDYEEIVTRAGQLAARYGLRSGDAIQLASVLTITRESGKLTFVSLDEELRAAALAEGLTVLP